MSVLVSYLDNTDPVSVLGFESSSDCAVKTSIYLDQQLQKNFRLCFPTIEFKELRGNEAFVI